MCSEAFPPPLMDEVQNCGVKVIRSIDVDAHLFDKKVKQLAQSVRLPITYRYSQPPREFDFDESTGEAPVYTLAHGLLRTVNVRGEGAVAKQVL